MMDHCTVIPLMLAPESAGRFTGVLQQQELWQVQQSCSPGAIIVGT